MNLLHKPILLFLLPICASAAEHAEIVAMRAKIRASIHQHRPSTVIKQTRQQLQNIIPPEKREYQRSQGSYRQDLIQECWPSTVIQQARLELLRSERFSSLERITRKQPVIVKQRFADPLLPRLARLKASTKHLTLPVEDVQALCCYIDRIAIAEYPKLPVEQVRNAWLPTPS